MIKAVSDSMERFCDEAKANLGLRYIGSFNDLNSLAGDDMGELLKEERAAKLQGSQRSTVGKESVGNEHYEGKSRNSDLHLVNKSVKGKRADWLYDLSTPSHSPESLSEILFQHQEKENQERQHQESKAAKN